MSLLWSNKDNAIHIKGELVLQELAACCGEVGIRCEPSSLDLSNEDLFSSLDQEIGSELYRDGLIVNIDLPRASDLAL